MYVACHQEFLRQKFAALQVKIFMLSNYCQRKSFAVMTTVFNTYDRSVVRRNYEATKSLCNSKSSKNFTVCQLLSANVICCNNHSLTQL